ncbi:hypothetical protein [Polaromonas sp.]|uniref:hypothetical protein n=1 Tax=Polaromonas sp. TaxID=1869339 RepID=UPI0032663F09
MANEMRAVTAPLLTQLQLRSVVRAFSPTSRPFGPLTDDPCHLASRHQAIDDDLVALGYEPLTADQCECLSDPQRAEEAADMLDDLQARLGVGAAACEAAGLNSTEAQAIQADLAYNVDKAGRGYKQHEDTALRLQMHNPMFGRQ